MHSGATSVVLPVTCYFCVLPKIFFLKRSCASVERITLATTAPVSYTSFTFVTSFQRFPSTTFFTCPMQNEAGLCVTCSLLRFFKRIPGHGDTSRSWNLAHGHGKATDKVIHNTSPRLESQVRVPQVQCHRKATRNISGLSFTTWWP